MQPINRQMFNAMHEWVSVSCLLRDVIGGWSLAPSAEFNVTFNTADTEVTSTTLSAGLPTVKLSTEVVDELNDGVDVALPLSMDLLAAPSEWTT